VLRFVSRRPQVPDELRHGPFLGSAAIATGLLTARQLRSAAWIRLVRNVYLHRDVEQTGLIRAQALSIVMRPGAVVAGITAAWLHRVWNPRPGQLVPLEYARQRLDHSTGLTGARMRRRVLRVDDGPWSDVIEIGGILVLSPMRACFDLMRERSLVEAVVVVDAYARVGLLELPWFAAYVDAHRSWPGVRPTRLAVDLASARSESSGETRLRLVVVLAGFPPPLVNPPMYTGTPMVLCGYPDLVIMVKYPVLGLEYDGAYHDTLDQRHADNRRENRLALAGLPLLRYGAYSVARQRELIVAEISAMTGLRALAPLDDLHFQRAPKNRSF
jgi:hypothetical protein